MGIYELNARMSFISGARKRGMIARLEEPAQFAEMALISLSTSRFDQKNLQGPETRCPVDTFWRVPCLILLIALLTYTARPIVLFERLSETRRMKRRSAGAMR